MAENAYLRGSIEFPLAACRMIEKTEGVVLSVIPYNDHTHLVHLLTEQWGKVTVRVNVSRTRRGAAQRMMWAPLTLVEAVLSRPSGQPVATLREAHLLQSPYQLADVGKTAQCVYLAELLDRTIREVEANATLWRFVRQGLELLAMPQAGQANFHLVFTTRLSYLLGFRVDLETYAEGMMFDVSEGVFMRGPIYHPYYLNAESATWLHRLLLTDFAHLDQLALSHAQRNTLLDMMLTYLRIHIPEMGEVRSADVMKEVFEKTK